MDKKLKVQHIGFASGWGHTAEFRLVCLNQHCCFGINYFVKKKANEAFGK
jgi:hypothetical protein